jgi:outer membrane biosynthesis protein TonB
MLHTDAARRGLTATSPAEASARTGLNAVFLADVGQRLALLGVLVLGACASPRLHEPASPQPPPLPQTSQPPQQSQQSPQPQPPQPPQQPSMAARPLPAPASRAAYRDWDEFRLHAGRRLMDTNPDRTFTGPVPQPLLAIPVLEVELNADGSVRRITVQRQPSQARDTVQLAIDAVQRAAPFGDVSHLPRPWKFTEVFLFRDDRRFKPRALDL